MSKDKSKYMHRIYRFFNDLYSGGKSISTTVWVGFGIYILLYVVIPQTGHIAYTNQKLFCVIYGFLYLCWILNGYFIFNAIKKIRIRQIETSLGGIIALIFSLFYTLIPICKLFLLMPD